MAKIQDILTNVRYVLVKELTKLMPLVKITSLQLNVNIAGDLVISMGMIAATPINVQYAPGSAFTLLVFREQSADIAIVADKNMDMTASIHTNVQLAMGLDQIKCESNARLS